MRLIPFDSMNAIHSKLAKASEANLPADERRGVWTADGFRDYPFIPGDDPVELRPVRRVTATSKPTCPGIKGGQGHSGAELEQSADLLPVLALAGAIVLILACVL